jgi:hypothetical protein
MQIIQFSRAIETISKGVKGIEYSGQNTEEESEGISVMPLQLWYIPEIHAVDANHKNRRRADDRYHGEYFYDVILFVTDEAGGGILAAFPSYFCGLSPRASDKSPAPLPVSR